MYKAEKTNKPKIAEYNDKGIYNLYISNLFQNLYQWAPYSS